MPNTLFGRRFDSVLLLALALSLNAPAFAVLEKPLKPSAATKTHDDAAGDRLPDHAGIKHAVGVLDFENEAGLLSQYSLGENLRMMLESALAASGRFVVVERGDLGAVLTEQDLQQTGRAAKASDTAQTGKIRSARYLAAGAVTEASESTSGEQGGINIRGFRIGGTSKKAEIVVVVKLIDTTTGEIVASERVRGVAGRTGVDLGYTGAEFSGSLGSFVKTPAGEAAQDCINQAVKFISAKMESLPVEGAVVAVSGEKVIVSLGENFRLATGQKLTVRKDGQVLTDPNTGEVLERMEGELVGTLEVEAVHEKVSYCKLLDGTLPERGDRVIVQ